MSDGPMSDAGALVLFKEPRKRGRPRAIKVAREFTEALAAADWLTHADRAMIESGRLLAERVDAAEDDKALVPLLRELVGIMDRLGMSPRSRRMNGLGQDQTSEAVNPFERARDLLESGWDLTAAE